MRKLPISRRLIGLLAAYLVALQALILPLSMPAAAIHGAELCVTAPDGPAPPPAGQDHGCPCAVGCGMQCHGSALAAGTAESLPAPTFALAVLLAPPPVLQSRAPAARGPQLPRGPPAA
jgi:hypothetical protein